MLEMVDSVTAVMQSVTEKEEVRTVTERIEARESGVAMQTFWRESGVATQTFWRESGVAMQTFWMVESVPLMTKMFLVESVPEVDAMGRAEAKSHPATMAEATAGAETATEGEAATSCLDRHHHPSQDETPDKEGEHNSSPHTLPEKAFECVVPLGLPEVDFGAIDRPSFILPVAAGSRRGLKYQPLWQGFQAAGCPSGLARDASLSAGG